MTYDSINNGVLIDAGNAHEVVCVLRSMSCECNVTALLSKYEGNCQLKVEIARGS